MSSTKERIILVVCGLVAAAIAIALIIGGNPANMAICIACFIRDSAGALYLQTNPQVQYLRPEIIGIIIGAFIMALISKEYKPTAGSSPLTRFFLGFIMMIGCLVFLGCPLRMILRMAGGDLNAWVALIGFGLGILTGVFFLRQGFSLGRSKPSRRSEGIILPIVALVLFILSVTTTIFAASTEGPASMHAPALLSLVAGVLFGVIAQKSRMCFAGSLRDIFLVRDFNGAIVIGILFLGVLVYNLIAGGFNLGFDNQPIAYNDALWNIIGMYVAGFAATLLGGCPLRTLTLAGSGSGDSAVTFLGLLVGAAFAHNFGIASSAAGPTFAGQIASVVCIVVLFGIALINIKRKA